MKCESERGESSKREDQAEDTRDEFENADAILEFLSGSLDDRVQT